MHVVAFAQASAQVTSPLPRNCQFHFIMSFSSDYRGALTTLAARIGFAYRKARVALPSDDEHLLRIRQVLQGLGPSIRPQGAPVIHGKRRRSLCDMDQPSPIPCMSAAVDADIDDSAFGRPDSAPDVLAETHLKPLDVPEVGRPTVDILPELDLSNSTNTFNELDSGLRDRGSWRLHFTHKLSQGMSARDICAYYNEVCTVAATLSNESPNV